MLPFEDAKSASKRSKPIGEDLSAWLRKQNAKIKKADTTGYALRHKRWLVNWLFYEGRQYGAWDKLDGQWIDAVPTKKNNFHIDNHFSWLIDSSQKEWARSKTKLVARPMHESQEASGAARKATDILAQEQRRLRTPIEHQGEGLTAAMCGVYARYTTYSVNRGNIKGQMPRMATKPMTL